MRFFEVAEHLYTIQEKKLWESNYDSFREFLDDAKMTEGNASMLIKVYRHYVIEGGASVDKLTNAGYSSLYAAIPLIEKHGMEHAIQAASTLTRAEIKDEVRDIKHGEHEHITNGECWSPCTTCNKFTRIQHGVSTS